tara:strand:- start:57 stop:245 length:189 start_codon:yes stop_codon:yes gene_type:complete
MKIKLIKEFPEGFGFGGLPDTFLKMKVGDQLEMDEIPAKINEYVEEVAVKKTTKSTKEEKEE